MEQPQPTNSLTLESNIDQLVQELNQLAGRVKPPDQLQRRDDAPSGHGPYLIASGRS